MSKLMLFQCLAASRPSYEDMFCVGRHIVARDLATCTTEAVTPAPVEAAPDSRGRRGGFRPRGRSPVAEAAAAASVSATAALNSGR
jgi:hypothetical protein